MTSKEKIKKILEMRYAKHLRPSDIAKRLRVSKAYITKIIKPDKRYSSERKKQKEINRKKNKAKTKIIIYAKREVEKLAYETLRLQHHKDVGTLSRKARLSKRDNAKWNRSAYEYDKYSSDLVIRKDIVISYAMPCRVSNIVNPNSIK